MDEVAVLWDYENVRVVAQGVNVPMAESLIAYAESIGHPRIMKVYANWRGISDTITQALYSLGFEPIQVSMGKTNSVDMKLAVDCLSIAQELPSIKHFIIITGDKDYIPLVTRLRTQQKHVTVIGRPEVVSEHLLLSADTFISLEELSKKVLQRALSKEAIEPELLSFDEGVACLLEALNEARNQDKTSRYSLIDQLMRSSSKYNYTGVKSSIQKPDGSGTFASFSDFIDAIEGTGKIKTQTVEGFKEIYLPEENPDIESEFSQTPYVKIEETHWRQIFNFAIQICGEQEQKQEKCALAYLHNCLRKSKRELNLPYSNKVLRDALYRLINIGFLVKNPEGGFQLNPNYKEKLEEYLKQVVAGVL